MDTSKHDLNALFSQLGLDNSDEAIEAFLSKQPKLSQVTLLHEASIWNPSQAAFLKEAVEEDAAWVDAVNHLDTLLRK
ncbi:MAG: DUF2789 domain-containing protein [Thiomicrospira sp.]|nr:MAG: DUF2789 domain-containing protein [Thiomicrospira sp.]